MREKLVPLGKYWRTRPLVFSLLPRCQGLRGSAEVDLHVGGDRRALCGHASPCLGPTSANVATPQAVCGRAWQAQQQPSSCPCEEDGAVKSSGIVVVGATNNPGMIDPALLRSGRLEKHIVIPRPDTEALIGILRHHLKGELDAVVARAPARIGSRTAVTANAIPDRLPKSSPATLPRRRG